MRATRSRLRIRFDSRSPCGAPVARLAQTAATSSSSRSAGTARVTSPYAAASAPLNTSPPRVVRAAARGFIRWCTVRLMIAAARPSLTSVSAKVASSALIAMSAAAMMPMPPARTAPRFLVTTGLSSVAMRRCRSTIRRVPASMPSAAPR